MSYSKDKTDKWIEKHTERYLNIAAASVTKKIVLKYRDWFVVVLVRRVVCRRSDGCVAVFLLVCVVALMKIVVKMR